MRPELPIGFRPFSRNAFINYQLNRWHSLGYARPEDLEEAGRRIRRFEDNKPVFLELADRAAREGRKKNAAFYVRAAEFLTDPEDRDKEALYRRFRSEFYAAFAEDGLEQIEVPFAGSKLPVSRLRPASGKAKGTVLIHGGFDSFIEEFYCFWQHFADRGYEVIAFEGPGQGGARALYGHTADHDWEKPVGAVLDALGIDDCTLLGISFGGYWCVRAAAFEKRIKRVIVHAPLFDLVEPQPGFVKASLRAMMKRGGFLNASIRMRMKAIPVIRHTVRHALHILGKTGRPPIAAAQWLLGMNRSHISAEKVDQDVLLLAGEKDRFQPLNQYRLLKEALTGARSVADRVFTKAEHAQNHCQMGNLTIALDEMTNWLDRIS